MDEDRNLRIARRSEHAATLLAGGPDLGLNFLIPIMGIGIDKMPIAEAMVSILNLIPELPPFVLIAATLPAHQG